MPHDLAFSMAMAQCAPFEPRPALAIALSGGIDSMALILLAERWARTHDARLIALTVDHGLRPESAAEAEWVRDWCAARGIEQHTLHWHPPETISNIQMQARDARYRLLTDYCREHHILHLLTAHHRDDQAETLFFRLARGSSIAGLAAMPLCSVMHGVRLLRPLLAFPKSLLKAFLQTSGQTWVEDPSNQCVDYTRNYLRALLAAASDADTVSQRASAVACSFGNIRNHLENKLAIQLTEAISLFPYGYALVHHDHFAVLPPVYALQSLAALILTLTGRPYAPRSEKLQRLYMDILTRRIVRRSLAGLLFTWRVKQNAYCITREPSALQSSLLLEANAERLWDNRFIVKWHGSLSEPLTVRALGADGLRLIPTLPVLPKTAAAVLPSFWHLDELLAVPHIGYSNSRCSGLTCTARFHAAKPLAAPAFFSMNKNAATP